MVASLPCTVFGWAPLIDPDRGTSIADSFGGLYRRRGVDRPPSQAAAGGFSTHIRGPSSSPITVGSCASTTWQSSLTPARQRPQGPGPSVDYLNTPYLERLAGVGAPADTIDVVFCTHLHHDHCGWKTIQADGRWLPTFSNAVYLFGQDKYRRWDSANPERHPNNFNPSVFDECVRPIVEAGQARIISNLHRVSASLTIEAAPGHTVGHSFLRLVSDSVGPSSPATRSITPSNSPAQSCICLAATI